MTLRSKQDSEQYGNIHEGSSESWESWETEPLLRKSSYTAKQLYYLTPKSVHLESRRLFIGDFPSSWVEKQAPNVINEAWKIVKSMEEKENVDSREYVFKQQEQLAADQIAKLVHPLKMENYETAARKNKEIERKRMLIRQETISNIRKHLKIPSVPSVSTQSTESTVFFDAPEGGDEAFTEVQDNYLTAKTEPLLNLNSSTHSVLELDKNDTSNSDTLVNKVTDDESLGTFATFENNLALAESMAHGADLGTNPVVHIDPSASNTSILNPTGIANLHHTLNKASRIPGRIQLDPHKMRHAAVNAAGNVAGNVVNTVGEVNPEAVMRQIKKVSHRHRVMSYMGRYLVQERLLDPGQSLNSESDTASRSKLVSRWKEYAIFMRQTSDPSKPIVLYLYASVNQAKLTRRSQRKWSHSLEYKIKIDSSYGISLFSTLNFSIALSRYMDYGVRVLILQSSSQNSIFDLTCILMAASQAFPETDIPTKVVVDVLYVDLKIELDSYLISQAQIEDPKERIGYSEIKSVTSSYSNFVRTASQKVFGVISKLSAPAYKKLAFAWVFPEYSHTAFWLTGTTSNMSHLFRINQLLPSTAMLAAIHPEPTCYAGHEVPEVEEPPPAEGHCSKIEVARGTKSEVYLHVHDHYLLISTKYTDPPLLASSQDSVVKTVNPYPMDENRDIKWIKSSTCAKEVEYHNALAVLEHRRTVKLVASASILIDLMSNETIETDDKRENIVVIKRQGDIRCALTFSTPEIAQIWKTKLKDTAAFWFYKLSFPKPNIEQCITPYLQNRSIVMSSTMFIKNHRMATFKSCVVLLTPTSLVVFRPSQKGTHVAHPRNLVPKSSLPQRKYSVIDLKDCYMYSGQLAAHALLDNHRIDCSDPVNRGLPCIYENGQTGSETEVERTIVVWQIRKSKLEKLVSETGSGNYVALLAKNKPERDQWALAIRYVLSNLASRPFEHEEQEAELNEEILETDLGGE